DGLRARDRSGAAGGVPDAGAHGRILRLDQLVQRGGQLGGFGADLLQEIDRRGVKYRAETLQVVRQVRERQPLQGITYALVATSGVVRGVLGGAEDVFGVDAPAEVFHQEAFLRARFAGAGSAGVLSSVNALTARVMISARSTSVSASSRVRSSSHVRSARSTITESMIRPARRLARIASSPSHASVSACCSSWIVRCQTKICASVGIATAISRPRKVIRRCSRAGAGGGAVMRSSGSRCAVVRRGAADREITPAPPRVSLYLSPPGHLRPERKQPRRSGAECLR